MTEASDAPEVRAQPVEPTAARARRGGGGEGAGGGGGDEGGRDAAGADPSHRGTAWWRAERLLAHGLRGLTFIPLVALVLIVGRAGVEGAARHPLQRVRVLHPDPLEPGQHLRPHRHHQRDQAPPAGPVRGPALHRRHPGVLGHRPGPGRAGRHRHRAHRGGEAPAPPVERASGSASRSWPGCPSVVYGLWGFFTLGPFLSHDVAPLWADHMPDVPVLRFFRRPDAAGGQGLFTAGVVLAIMILPDHRGHHPRPAAPGAPGHGGGGGGPGHDRLRGAGGGDRSLGPVRGDRGLGARSGPRPGGDDRRGHGVRVAHRRRGPLVLQRRSTPSRPPS